MHPEKYWIYFCYSLYPKYIYWVQSYKCHFLLAMLMRITALHRCFMNITVFNQRNYFEIILSFWTFKFVYNNLSEYLLNSFLSNGKHFLYDCHLLYNQLSIHQTSSLILVKAKQSLRNIKVNSSEIRTDNEYIILVFRILYFLF